MNSRAMTIAGWIPSGLFVLFMLGASVAPKLAGMQVADDTMRQLGWPDGYVLMIGIIELILVLLYIFPRTAVLGAVLMMALLGGAMATQIRVGNPVFSHQLFSVYLGLFMWGGLWLREPALRAIFPEREDVASADVRGRSRYGREHAAAGGGGEFDRVHLARQLQPDRADYCAALVQHDERPHGRIAGADAQRRQLQRLRFLWRALLAAAGADCAEREHEWEDTAGSHAANSGRAPGVSAGPL